MREKQTVRKLPENIKRLSDLVIEEWFEPNYHRIYDFEMSLLIISAHYGASAVLFSELDPSGLKKVSEMRKYIAPTKNVGPLSPQRGI